MALRKMTYASTGVDRSRRERSRKKISSFIARELSHYPLGRPIELPFGFVFPQDKKGSSFFDLQIEGVGTKTLLSELTGNYETIGLDAVAMVVNDVIRSGARPILLTDAIHIARSDEIIINSILHGIRKGAQIANCVLGSGETGNVQDILHIPLSEQSDPFDLFVSSLGVVERKNLVKGIISEGDLVIAMESSGVHSNGLSLARKILLKRWGGFYDQEDAPSELGRRVIDELLEPTRIYVRPFVDALRSSKIKAAIHITGDGFAKFGRILHFQKRFNHNGSRLGFDFDLPDSTPPVFRLIQETAWKMRSMLSQREMFRTFNMGFGFAVVVDKQDEQNVIDSFNRHYPSRRIGMVTRTGRIAVHFVRPKKGTMVL